MKLWFFGDSYTFGHGLPDCSIYNCEFDSYDPGPVPSKLGWANIVATRTGLPHVNLSLPGMSNLKIHWTMRHVVFEPNDIVITQWSFPTRCVILDNEMEEMYTWATNNNSENFFKAHSLLDLERRSLLIIEHTELLLKSLGVKYAAFANTSFDANMHAYSEILDYEDQFIIDRAPDMHPGIESNKAWAEQVLKLLKYKFGLDYE